MIDSFVFCKRDRLPTQALWQRWLLDAGFELVLPQEMDLVQARSVFVACKFEGLESGFDYAAKPARLGTSEQVSRGAL